MATLAFFHMTDQPLRTDVSLNTQKPKSSAGSCRKETNIRVFKVAAPPNMSLIAECLVRRREFTQGTVEDYKRREQMPDRSCIIFKAT